MFLFHLFWTNSFLIPCISSKGWLYLYYKLAVNLMKSVLPSIFLCSISLFIMENKHLHNFAFENLTIGWKYLTVWLFFVMLLGSKAGVLYIITLTVYVTKIRMYKNVQRKKKFECTNISCNCGWSKQLPRKLRVLLIG